MTQVTSFIISEGRETIPEELETSVIEEEETQEEDMEMKQLTDEVVEKLRRIKPSPSQETPLMIGDDEKEGTSKDEDVKEGASSSDDFTEHNEKIFHETLTRIRPLFEQVKAHTQAHREHNRQIGLIIMEEKAKIKGKKHGSMFIPRIADGLQTSLSYLSDVRQYAKVDPEEHSIIPENLAYLSWRRVVRCAKAAKTMEKFQAFLQNHADLTELSGNAFEALIDAELPRTERRGRKRTNEKPLNTEKAQTKAKGLGGKGETDSSPDGETDPSTKEQTDSPANGETNPPDGQTTPPAERETPPPPTPPASESTKLPSRVEQAFNDLVSAEDSPWKDGKIRVYSGTGCFEFQATFHSEEECVTVFQHFIDYLEKEAV